MQLTDDVLSRAKNGDQAAFADVVREHQAMVFSIANYFLRDRAAAEDQAQEVFIDLYRNIASIESPAHLKYWLRRVTGHRCIDYTRRNKMQTASFDEAPEPAAGPDSSDMLMTATLRRIVATLPEKPRLVVTLRYQEDLDPSEIAQILDMPVNTVKSHLRRSLVILREKVIRCFGDIEV
jgi:RNA polymerase sigma-70 factor (ECF subfamily)